MASKAPPALKQWASIIKRWPVDKVRPQSVAFQTVMQKRIDHLVNPSPSPQPATVKESDVTISDPPPVWNEDKQLKQVKILNALLENNNPTYYDDLIRELDEAPTRSYFNKVMNRVRGVLRFK